MAQVTTEKLIFERGLYIDQAKGTIHADHSRGVLEQSQEVFDRYGARLVLIVRHVDLVTFDTLDVLLRPDGNRLADGFGLPVQMFQPYPFLLADASYELLGAAYHCRMMAVRYAEICEALQSQIPKTGEAVPIKTHHEIYFRFDAIMTKARKLLDRLAWDIWRFFVNRPGRPDNFEQMLDDRDIADRVPSDLLDCLRPAWNELGLQIKHYRDNVHHLPRSGACSFSGSVEADAHAICQLTMPIPDNPEAKCERLFEYQSGKDALTYSWEALAYLADIGDTIANSIASRFLSHGCDDVHEGR
ncbi:MAG TPA: hypothetical protein VL175_20840 [Pirellulales bacterium]|jgi:hypothetical protein|nr:hypothetical protein [Pirellulales bacterium]